jgi:tRNA threonylcarbamoyladenosine modification (KEOPS) complex  Pcc1 subunit
VEDDVMKAKATIHLKFPTIKHLKTVQAALLPEVNKPGSGRARVTLDNDGTFLVLIVEADDTVALRSTLNAYLRWINSTASIVDALNQS